MIDSIKDAIDELAHHLDDLRRRSRATARAAEVGRAVGGTLHDLAVDAICGSTPMPSRTAYDDYWDEPYEDQASPWSQHSGDARGQDEVDGAAVRIRGALLAGLTAGRWTLRRFRQPAIAIAVGLLAGLAALLGGPAIERSIEAWLTAHDLFGTLRP